MFRVITVFAIVLFLLSACASAASTPDSIPVKPTPTLPPVMVVASDEAAQTPVAFPTPSGDEGECDNPFYPVADEATWFFSISTGGNAIHTMSADDFGKFTTTVEVANSTFSIDGQCNSEGIIIMDVPGGQTTYSGEYGSSAVSTVTVSGVSLPNDIAQGRQWTQTISVTTEAGRSEIVTNYTAVGFENVTVPAGEFYALKIEQDGFVTVFGQKVAMHGFNWYAEGVGPIKSAMDGAPTVELTMYDIPD